MDYPETPPNSLLAKEHPSCKKYWYMKSGKQRVVFKENPRDSEKDDNAIMFRLLCDHH